MQNASQVISGGEDVIGLLSAYIKTSGHVLLEDVPRMGKTLSAKAAAKSLDCSFKRIQFTPHCLPSDITDISCFYQKTCGFQFRPRPVQPYCRSMKLTGRLPEASQASRNAWRKNRMQFNIFLDDIINSEVENTDFLINTAYKDEYIKQ